MTPPLRIGSKLGILAFLVLATGLAPYSHGFVEAMRQARDHQAAQEYGQALTAYERATELDRHAALPRLGSAVILLAQHRFLEAASAFHQAERRGAGVSATIGLGESFAGQQDWAAALQVWYRAQRTAPGDPRLLISLAEGSIAQGQFDRAREYLAAALESDLRPDRFALWARGTRLGMSSQELAAEVHGLLGRLLAGDDPVAAQRHLQQAGDDDMLAVLQAAAAEADPARRSLLLGAAFLQRDDLALARHYLQRSVALGADDPEALAYLAHTLDRLGETGAARAALEQAIALDPASTIAQYFLAIHLRQVGYVRDAQAVLWEALQREPVNAALRAEMAKCFEELSDYPQAEEWYNGAAEAAPEDPAFQQLLAHFYVDHLYHIEAEAVPAAQKAVEMAPEDPAAHDILGWAYVLAGQPVEGEQSLRQALALDPTLVRAHFHLGSLYSQAGSRTQAQHHLQRAIDLDTTGFYRERAQATLEGMD
ncbi:MAG: tetratricopeptide repeat protein [Anaerolineae bacterium]|nr:tetratricopeptide repeat protein [Anaerolineae bacterium]